MDAILTASTTRVVFRSRYLRVANLEMIYIENYSLFVLPSVQNRKNYDAVTLKQQDLITLTLKLEPTPYPHKRRRHRQRPHGQVLH
jgi:hypothetical protein